MHGPQRCVTGRGCRGNGPRVQATRRVATEHGDGVDEDGHARTVRVGLAEAHEIEDDVCLPVASLVAFVMSGGSGPRASREAGPSDPLGGPAGGSSAPGGGTHSQINPLALQAELARIVASNATIST